MKLHWDLQLEKDRTFRVLETTDAANYISVGEVTRVVDEQRYVKAVEALKAVAQDDRLNYFNEKGERIENPVISFAKSTLRELGEI